MAGRHGAYRVILTLLLLASWIPAGFDDDATTDDGPDLLQEADHAGIARAIMLKAIQERASAKDDTAAADIYQALEPLADIAAHGSWFELIRRAFWLAARAAQFSEGHPPNGPPL